MGLHTWFLKSKELYLKQQILEDTLGFLELDDNCCENPEYFKLFQEIDDIEEENEADYHDLFRTNKRNDDGTYINEIFFSKKECFDWINNPKNEVYYQSKEDNLKQLNEFWEKYPNGVIFFL